MGVVAKAEGDLERSATLWQQVLDRDPNFGHKTLATFMEQLQQQLQPYRIQRLKELALQAQKMGEWGQEIGAWQALLGLEPQNAEAKQAISIAQTNLQHAWMYENAVQFAQQGQAAAAREQLNMLWQVAPDYGDPAGLAEKVDAFPVWLKESYVGTMTTTDGASYEIEFSSITQSTGIVKGTYLEGSTSGVFEGTVKYNGDLVFIVAENTDVSDVKFAGKVQPDGHLAGTWEDSGGHGTWEAQITPDGYGIP